MYILLGFNIILAISLYISFKNNSYLKTKIKALERLNEIGNRNPKFNTRTAIGEPLVIETFCNPNASKNN